MRLVTVPSIPASIAESTMSALNSIMPSTTPLALPNITALMSDIESEFSRLPIRSSTTENTKISAPQNTGTNRDGFQPKNAAISCPLAYPAPIIVPTPTIATENTFFTIVYFYSDFAPNMRSESCTY